MALSSNVQKFGAAAMAALSIGAAANDAGAQSQGQSVLPPSAMRLDTCYSTREQFVAGLREGDQSPLVIADAKMVNENGRILIKNYITASSDLSNGFHFVLNERGYCKSGEIRHLRVFNALSSNIDNSAFLEPFSNRGAGTLNYTILSSYQNFGEVPVVRGYIVRNNTYTHMITVTTQPNNQSGTGGLIISNLQGGDIIIREFLNPIATPAAQQFMSRPVVNDPAGLN